MFRGIPLLLVLLLVSGFLSSASVARRRRADSAVDRRALSGSGSHRPFWYGVIALTITYGAYMAEVYRAGIEAVPRGQMEAARSLGMSHGQSMRFVIVPQAVRKVIPPLLNDFIALMKDTSLVSFLGLIEVVQAGFDYQTLNINGSALTLGAILFLVVTIPLARLVDWLIAREQTKTQRGGGGGEEHRQAPLRPGWRALRMGDEALRRDRAHDSAPGRRRQRGRLDPEARGHPEDASAASRSSGAWISR